MSERLQRGFVQAYRWTIAGMVAVAITNIPDNVGIWRYIGGLLGVLTIIILAALFSAYVIQPFDPDSDVEAFWT